MKRVTLTVNRKYPKEGYTIGELLIDGKYYCDTLEDKDRGLDCTMPLELISMRKVYGETAIPCGRFLLEFEWSPKFNNRRWAKDFGGKVIAVKDVYGFEGVKIHPFNRPEESLGCIGVGCNTIKGQITRSEETYLRLVEYLRQEWAIGSVVTLEVKRAYSL